MRTYHKCGILGNVSFLFSFIILISHIGCIATKTVIEGTPVNVSVIEPHLETLQVRYDLTETLKTTKMMVSIQEGQHKSEELRELLYYKKTTDGSELLRIQVLGIFDDTKGVAIANRDQFLLSLLDERETYVGKLSDGILNELFGIDLRVSDVLSAIFANPFLDGRTEDIKVTRSGNKYIITRPGIEDGHTEMITLLVVAEEPRVTEWSIKDKNGLLQQSASFTDYSEVDGILRPHTVKIKRPPEQTQVTVRTEKVQLNLDIKDSRFEFERFLTEEFTIKSLSDSELTDVPE